MICCSCKPKIEERPLLSMGSAAELGTLFKMFGNQTRLRLLHAILRAGEMRVTDLSTALTMKPAAVSNQLQRLVDRGIVAPRRDGNNVFYRIVDPCVPSLLEKGLCLLEDAKERARIKPADPFIENLLLGRVE